jgi:adenylate kinase
MRSAPNIIITGTPGVGKTTHSEILAERTGLRHLSVNQVVKDKECHEGWSDEYQSWIVDEDKVHIFSTFARKPKEENIPPSSFHSDTLPERNLEADLGCEFLFFSFNEQLLDVIEDDVKAGGCIIDWHACDLFPRSWIDLVVVLRVDSKTLYDRLEAR